MKTDPIQKTVAILKRGGVVAHACEGVWGLACDAWKEASVHRVLAIKGRIATKGLILIAHAPDSFEPELKSLPSARLKAVLGSWPGNHTWILNSSRFPEWVTGNGATIAARVPGASQARELAKLFGGVLISTSANRSGLPAAHTEQEVREQLGGDVDFILPGQIEGANAPSQITVALSGERLR